MLAREFHRLLHALALEEFELAHLLLGSGERSTNHFWRSVPDPNGPCFARRTQWLAENADTDFLRALDPLADFRDEFLIGTETFIVADNKQKLHRQDRKSVV